MTRKQSNTVDYFPHFVKPGKTIFILETKYGNDGYAFWFKLLELLCSTENHYIDCNDNSAWEFLVARTRVSGITGTEMIGLLAKLGNLDHELWEKARIIWCPNLIVNISDVYKKRERPAPTKPQLDILSISGTSNPVSPDISAPVIPSVPDNLSSYPQSKVKYSKVKYSKVCVPTKKVGQRAPRLSNNPQIAQMQEHLGFPKNGEPDPIPNPGKEANYIKKMLSRGFEWDKVFEFWSQKVSARGEFVSMQWVNDDIGGILNGKDRLETGAGKSAAEPAKRDWDAGRGGQRAIIHRPTV